MKPLHIPYPPSMDLARRPTPVQYLRKMSEKMGTEIYIKRDDLTGAALSGNKVRKLEFVMADARQKGADIVLTCGGAQSNHARATAVAAAMLGLRCRLLLRTADPAAPPPVEGNILLDKMAGAEIVWITPGEYDRRDERFEQEADMLRKSGLRPYIIPEGASNALGAWGYIRAMEELAADMADFPGDKHAPVTIVHACGSGGTAAGLILGAALLKVSVRVVSINVSDDRNYFVKAIGAICTRAIADYQLDVAFDPEKDIDIVDGYVGLGYAQSQPDELKMLRELARSEGVFLDPVYTGKAFYGLMKELESDPLRFGKRIVFIHTGGIFGLLAAAKEIAPYL